MCFNLTHFLLGLLLQGDNVVQLVVLCAEKPTIMMLKRVVNELPNQLKKIAEEHKYTVTMAPVEGAILVSDGTITVKVSLTSPLLREAQGRSSIFLLYPLVSFCFVMKSFSLRFRVTSFNCHLSFTKDFK